MAAYGFSEGDAKRIGKVVRLVERGPDKVRLSGPGGHGAAPGVRLLIAKHEGTSWPTQQTAVVTIYNGPAGVLGSVATLVAYNHFVKLSSQTNCTNRWVALGHNGWQWHVVEAANACDSTCSIEVNGVDFSVVPGYQETATQILGHASGCIKWFDITTCATA